MGLFQEEKKACLAVATLGELDTERREWKIRVKLESHLSSLLLFSVIS